MGVNTVEYSTEYKSVDLQPCRARISLLGIPCQPTIRTRWYDYRTLAEFIPQKHSKLVKYHIAMIH